MRSLAVTYSGMACGQTTIGAERFHFRVRNGIGWFPLAIAARQNRRNFLLRRLSRSLTTPGIAAGRISSMHHPLRQQTNALRLYGQVSRAISTGQLSALLRVHTRPINHVVFVGPLGESSSQGDLVLGGASRLDAFSGYPVCT
jgi:hypothetical protein